MHHCVVMTHSSAVNATVEQRAGLEISIFKQRAVGKRAGRRPRHLPHSLAHALAHHAQSPSVVSCFVLIAGRELTPGQSPA